MPPKPKTHAVLGWKEVWLLELEFLPILITVTREVLCFRQRGIRD